MIVEDYGWAIRYSKMKLQEFSVEEGYCNYPSISPLDINETSFIIFQFQHNSIPYLEIKFDLDIKSNLFSWKVREPLLWDSGLWDNPNTLDIKLESFLFGKCKHEGVEKIVMQEFYKIKEILNRKKI